MVIGVINNWLNSACRRAGDLKRESSIKGRVLDKRAGHMKTWRRPGSYLGLVAAKHKNCNVKITT
jgi:hypothetical protein